MPEGAGEAFYSGRDLADLARVGFVDVSVVSYVDGDVARPVEDVPRLRLRQGERGELATLVLGVVADPYAGLAVAVLGEPTAVQADPGGRASPDIGDAELAVGGLDDDASRRRAAFPILQAHPVEAVQAVGLHNGLEGLHVA